MKSHLESNIYEKTMINKIVGGDKVLELGPLHRPIVSKKEIADVKYIDYQSTEALRESNKDNPQVKIEDIVDLDYIWTPGKSLKDVIGDMYFDKIVASQVVEHVPNTIGWLRELFNVVRGGGTIVLGVPDKRYTFDAYRTETSVADLLDYYFNNESIPTTKQIYDCLSLAVKLDDISTEVDCSVPIEQRELLYTKAEALNFASFAYFHQKYLDMHCTVWTPASFKNCMMELNDLDVLPNQTEIIEIPEASSFVVYLTKTKQGRDFPPSRMETLLATELKSLRNDRQHLLSKAKDRICAFIK